MPALYPKLRQRLLTYKRANGTTRLAMLEDAKQSIEQLKNKPVNDAKAAIHAYQTMSAATTLINYAHQLGNIENGDWFDCMPYFDDLTDDKYFSLTQYFEFSSDKLKMRLKCTPASIPNSAWKLFQTAQVSYVERNKDKDIFDVTQIDIDHPPTDSLYPLPIQFLGELHNEAVHLLCPEQDGSLDFVSVEKTQFMLVGGSLVKKTKKKTEDTYQDQALTKYLAKHHEALLHKDTWHLLDEIEKDVFTKLLQEFFKQQDNLVNSVSTSPDSFILSLQNIIQNDTTNSKKMEYLIQCINNQKNPQPSWRNDLLIKLKVYTFKKTKIGQEAFKFIQQNSTVSQIPQFLDTRQAAGSQATNVVLMRNSLSDWFKKQYGNLNINIVGDLSVKNSTKISPLMALAHSENLKYSHDLILCHSHVTQLVNGFVTFDKSNWDNEAPKTFEAIVARATKMIETEQEAFATRTRCFEAAIAELNNTIENKIDPTQGPKHKSLKKYVNQLSQKIKRSASNNDLPTLTVIASDTSKLLNGELKPEAYQERAKEYLLNPDGNKALMKIGMLMALIGEAMILLASAALLSPVVAIPLAAVSLLATAGFFYKGLPSKGLPEHLRDISTAKINLGG